MDEIITAVNKEDLLCIEIVEEIGQKLGRQIAGLISIFNPELVIIGGTLSSTGDYIVQPINGNKEILIESSQQRRHSDYFQAKRQGWGSWGLHAGTEQNVRNLRRTLPV